MGDDTVAIVKRTRRGPNAIFYLRVGHHRVNRIFALVEIETRAAQSRGGNPWLLGSNRADLIANRQFSFLGLFLFPFLFLDDKWRRGEDIHIEVELRDRVL